MFNSAEKDFLKRYDINVDAAIADAEAARRANPAQKQAYKLELGGSSVQGNGGAVTVKSSDAFATSGVNAFGILAQSIGGGGGYTGALSTGTVGCVSFLGGVNRASGRGGTVRIEMSGNGQTEVSTTAANLRNRRVSECP